MGRSRVDWVGVSLSGKGDARRLAVTIATFRSYMELDAIAPVATEKVPAAQIEQSTSWS